MDEPEFIVKESQMVTKEIAEQVGKGIPHRIVSSGWELSYCRFHDGASYDQ